MIKINSIPCAGFIVFKHDETSNKLQTLIVRTKNNYGFPKGKKNKNEQITETALRELEEESGLKLENIKILSDIDDQSTCLFEYSANNNVCVIYFIAECTKDIEFTFDASELDEVGWHDVDTIGDKLNIKNRELILKNAVDFYNSCKYYLSFWNKIDPKG